MCFYVEVGGIEPPCIRTYYILLQCIFCFEVVGAQDKKQTKALYAYYQLLQPPSDRGGGPTIAVIMPGSILAIRKLMDTRSV